MPNVVRESAGLYSLLILVGLTCIGCGGEPSVPSQGHGGSANTSLCRPQSYPGLVINEVSSNNDGNAVDEFGNADDWLELANRGSTAIQLSDVVVMAGDKAAQLPSEVLDPGEHLLLWADNSPSQGAHHLPFKLKSTGQRLQLQSCGQVLTQLELPSLGTDEVRARFPDLEGDFQSCRYATPGRANGSTCGPPAPVPVNSTFQYLPFSWSLPHPSPPTQLAIDELALSPAQFIEIRNVSQNTLNLDDYQLRLAPLRPGIPWPDVTQGTSIAWSADTLAPGERITVPVSATDVAPLFEQSPSEGVVTLFDNNGLTIDRVDFARWPANAALARTDAYPGRLVFCTPATPEAANDGCEILPARDVGDYVRHLRTLDDFRALTAGSGELGMASVKFILDMAAGNQIYLVGARDWSLHYEFVRELIYQQPHLNRCDSIERDLFDLGWYRFSVSEYFQTTGRRFLLGTLVHHAAADLYTVEFALGDAILPEDMRKAFFAATSHALVPTQFSLRPQDDEQSAYAQELNGTLPIVDQNAPFSTTKLQPLAAGVGYGVLTYVPLTELQTASLGPDVIVVTDDVPTDIPLVGGLITEAFQTPLSHVNVLCQNRGTPNLALPHAHLSAEFGSLFGKLVRFEVTSDGFQVGPTSAEEAQAFWDSRKPSQVAASPRLDLERAEFVDLQRSTLADLPAIGAKAAQLAELIRLSSSYVPDCDGAVAFEVPKPAFAVPMSYFAQHAQVSGAATLLDDLLADPDAYANRTSRHARLEKIRSAIRSTPVDPSTLNAITELLRQHFGTTRVRMRSSSNAEDLPGFNGAGLYSSVSAAVDDPDYPVADALREVWASLYSDRGFDERVQFNVEQRGVAMAVLVHPAFPEERANAVVVSRNLDDVTRGDIYTFNSQLGEASVTNPAPGVSSDQYTYQWPPRTPALAYKTFSSFNGGVPVLTEREVVSAACALRAIVQHFQPLLDPTESNRYFTMDMEMKLLGDDRRLLIKQARPYAFGNWTNPGDCREF